jgi:hypothetical protein
MKERRQSVEIGIMELWNGGRCIKKILSRKHERNRIRKDGMPGYWNVGKRIKTKASSRKHETGKSRKE